MSDTSGVSALPTNRAHAKLNLFLRVLGREESGYHSLETLFLRLELADDISLQPGAPGLALETIGDRHVPAGPENLCWRAAERLGREAKRPPALRIVLDKRIPSGAGLGGGSADAAAVLRYLNEMWNRPLEPADLMRLAGEIGSDVPFGLCDRPMALAWERGRRLLPLLPPPSRPVAVAVPPFSIGAAQAYGWLAEDRRSGAAACSAGALPPPAALADWEELGRLAHNDLETVVLRRHPELAHLKTALRAGGAEIAMLCGSGSCVAGIFPDAADRETAARAIEGSTNCRVIRTRTIGEGSRPLA